MKLEITIAGNSVEVDDYEKLPLTIDYAVEESADFQSKGASKSVDITIPATLLNRQGANSFHSPSVEDLTAGEVFRNPQPAVIKAGGAELLVGKAMLSEATHTDRPEDYTYNFFGGNADWMIDLADTTLFDLLKFLNFAYTKQQIVDSWQFNGRNEALPFVFAPVRYRNAMEKLGDKEDYSMLPGYMKPSLSKYFILMWGLKVSGYKIQSDFLNTDFFRRQVMPWTWGSFLSVDDSRQDNLKFLAKSTTENVLSATYTGFWDLFVSNDNTNGAFDNNDVYAYNVNDYSMNWTYKTQFNYGAVDATFRIDINIIAEAAGNGDSHLWVYWYRNGVFLPDKTTDVYVLEATNVFTKRFTDLTRNYQTIYVQPGDVVSAKIWVRNQHHILGNFPNGSSEVRASVDGFDFEYFRIPIDRGGVIDFQNYSGLKNYKFLDFFRGLIDEFNLMVATDTTRKVVLIEPEHDYTLPDGTKGKGFFNGDFVDWQEKLDLSQKATMQLFSDHEREVNFSYKDDSSDGGYKTIKDRNSNVPAAATYVLPSRFKKGKKGFDNRFFSALTHYEVAQWKKITGVAPQMPCMIPENISNTSEGEAENTFTPKSAYYKGLQNGLGWVFDGVEQQAFPLMFSVNYLPGGEQDPVLSYTDEKIGTDQRGYSLAQGLFKKFFWQRMAITRNGQWHTALFRLNNKDAAQPWHREHKVYLNQRWELVNIQGYAPLKPGSTKCLLRRWAPLAQTDFDNSFPSQSSILNNVFTGTFDIKYAKLLCLTSDIPK